MSTNIVNAVFGASRIVRGNRDLYQWDHGQILRFNGIELPDSYTVHFSNSNAGGVAKQMIGNSEGVEIPYEYLITGQPVYAWVYLHTGLTDGETMYAVIINVIARPEPVEEEPTPVQRGLIEQAVAALNAAVVQTEADVRDAAGSAEAALGAQSAAEAARSAAEAAERLAEENAGESTISARAAAVSASEAERYADAAAGLVSDAANSASDAADSASDAERSAERAEQAAASAGYLDVEIDANGHLIYTRTDAVDVDFELVDGHLIMEVV